MKLTKILFAIAAIAGVLALTAPAAMAQVNMDSDCSRCSDDCNVDIPDGDPGCIGVDDDTAVCGDPSTVEGCACVGGTCACNVEGPPSC